MVTTEEFLTSNFRSIHNPLLSSGNRKIKQYSFEDVLRFMEAYRVYLVSDRPNLKQALELLRDLADIQNGPPLVTVQEEWKEIMDNTYRFLEQHEG